MPAPSLLASLVILAILQAILGAWIWAIVRLAMQLPVLPPFTPRLVPWGGGSALASLIFWLALSASVPLSYLVATRPRPVAGVAGKAVAPNLKPGELMTLSALSNAATLVLVPLLLAATSGARLRDLGVVRPGFAKQMVRGVVAYPLLAPIVFGAMALSLLVWKRQDHELQKAILEDRSPGMVIILVLAAVVLAPAAEELIFRGALLGWLTRLALKKPPAPASMGASLGEPIPGDAGPLLPETVEIEAFGASPGLINPQETTEQVITNLYAPPVATIEPAVSGVVALDPGSRALPLLGANIIVSLIFAVLHAPVWPTPIPLFFLSIGLGILYQRTGSILGPTALHMTFNGISTLMMFLSIGDAPAPKPAPKLPDPAPALRAIDRGKILAIGPIDGPPEVWYSFLPQRHG
jgi:membrane protease YdiL (CAAX protease family)